MRQVASLPNPTGAELVAARDFNGDGRVDFVWHNYATGILTRQSVRIDPKLNPPISQLYAAPVAIASGLGTNILVSTGDYDGDQWLDLLWRDATGRLQIMYLVDGNFDQLVALAFAADDASRFVVGSTDMDGIPGDEIAIQHGIEQGDGARVSHQAHHVAADEVAASGRRVESDQVGLLALRAAPRSTQVSPRLTRSPSWLRARCSAWSRAERSS